MKKYTDLHTHTTVSDGSMSPVQLIKYAAEKGLNSIAITDHDTIDGIDAALKEAKLNNIDLIPGIEISVDYNVEMHILGYFNEKNYMTIKNVLDELVNSRNKRNIRILGKLKELGMDITYDEIDKEANGNIIGRPHIAQVMLNKGYIKTREEAFKKYLGENGKAYFKKSRLTPEEGIKAILKAGGVPVLAHPIHLNLSLNELEKELDILVKFGLKGMEVFYVDNKGDDTGNLIRLAKKYNLIMTGGSDFHGKYKNNIDIGIGRGNLEIPFECYERLKKEIEISI